MIYFANSEILRPLQQRRRRRMETNSKSAAAVMWLFLLVVAGASAQLKVQSNCKLGNFKFMYVPVYTTTVKTHMHEPFLV